MGAKNAAPGLILVSLATNEILNWCSGVFTIVNQFVGSSEQSVRAVSQQSGHTYCTPASIGAFEITGTVTNPENA